jgi:anaerobic selenocysteine-containing dehydrogenase
MDPLPFWYEPFEQASVDRERYRLHALTQRPMHMYHSWGSQNAWLRQITSQNRLFIHRRTAEELGIDDDDWVWIESLNGRVRGQVKLMDGVNPSTVWTWNAIGKRKGAWGLKEDAAETNRGFLLNHAIADLLPPDQQPIRLDPQPVLGLFSSLTRKGRWVAMPGEHVAALAGRQNGGWWCGHALNCLCRTV